MQPVLGGESLVEVRSIVKKALLVNLWQLQRMWAMALMILGGWLSTALEEGFWARQSRSQEMEWPCLPFLFQRRWGDLSKEGPMEWGGSDAEGLCSGPTWSSIRGEGCENFTCPFWQCGWKIPHDGWGGAGVWGDWLWRLPTSRTTHSEPRCANFEEDGSWFPFAPWSLVEEVRSSH